MGKIFSSKAALRSVLGSMLIQICVGIIYLWSVLKEPVQNAFEMETSAANMVSSYMLMGFVIGCLIGGIFVDKFRSKLTNIIGVVCFAVGIAATGLLTPATAWLINFTYAGLGGLGSGIAYSSCISCIQKWMPENRGLASGLAVSAFGASTVVFVTVIRSLIAAFEVDGEYNMSPVFFILGGIFFVVGMIGCLLVKNPPKPQVVEDLDDRTFTFGQALKLPKFWIIFFMAFFMNAPYTLATPVLYDLGIERGLLASIALLTVTLTGVANVAGRLSMATLSDKFGRKNILMGLFLLTLCAAAGLTMIEGAGYVVLVLIMALAFGGMSSVNATLGPDYFGVKNSGKIYGVIMLALGLSSIVFNFLTDSVFGGSAGTRFLLGCVSSVLAFIMLIILNAIDAKDVKWNLEMSTTQIKTFITTTKTMNYAKTAERLYTSPANVAKSISSLENELGVKLFEKGEDNLLRLTDSGEVMKDILSDDIKKTNMVIRKAQIVSNKNNRHLWVGTVNAEYASDIDVEVMNRFSKQTSDVDIMIYKGFVHDILNMIENGKLDLAMIEASALKVHPSVEHMVTKQVRLGVVVSRGSSLSELDEISLSDLKEQTFLTIDPQQSPLVEATVNRMCLAAGFTPKTLMASDAIELIILLEQGSGVAILPENHHAYFDPMLKFIPFREGEMVDLVCCWKASNSNPVLKECLDVYRNVIAEERK